MLNPKEGPLKTSIPETKFNHLVEYIIKEYCSFGPINIDGKIVFSRLTAPSDLRIFSQKPIIPFKNILLPNNQKVSEKQDHKIALIGLNNCDIWAYHHFMDQFEHTDLLPEKDSILIVGMECQPDNNCFCDVMGLDKYAQFDLFFQKGKKDFEIFADSVKGRSILKTIGLKEITANIELKKISENRKKLDLKALSSIIENKAENIDLWQGIANNCFGCGACSTVCPLCFCTRQFFENDIEGKSSQCLKWDSCFAKCFSEIQNRHDLRPTNSDRLYNWYHHKFVRSYFKNRYALCTGCGRCITACPANLNIKNIISLLAEKND